MNLFGTEFFLDGVLLDGVTDEAFAITNLDATLSGILADGSDFSFNLTNSNFFGDGALNVTLVSVPEPASITLIGLLGGIAMLRRRRKSSGC